MGEQAPCTSVTSPVTGPDGAGMAEVSGNAEDMALDEVDEYLEDGFDDICGDALDDPLEDDPDDVEEALLGDDIARTPTAAGEAPVIPPLHEGRIQVLFTASWCPVHTQIRDKVAANAGSEVLVEVDIDVFPELAEQWRVMTVPTLLTLSDGDERRRVSGTAVVGTRKKVPSTKKR